VGEKKSDDQFTDEQTARRRDAVIKHMLNTPPKPRKEMTLGKRRKAKTGAKANPPKKLG
jgi:hypothetical protein